MDWRAVFGDLLSHAAEDVAPLSCVKSLYSFVRNNWSVPGSGLRQRLRQIQRLLMKPVFQHVLGTWISDTCKSEDGFEEFRVHALVCGYSLSGTALAIEVLASIVSAIQSSPSSQLSDVIRSFVSFFCAFSHMTESGRDLHSPLDPLDAVISAMLNNFGYDLSFPCEPCGLRPHHSYLLCRNASIHTEIIERAGGMLDRVVEPLAFTVPDVLAAFVITCFQLAAAVRPVLLSAVLNGISAAGDDMVARKPWLSLLESLATPECAELLADSVDVMKFWLRTTPSPTCSGVFSAFVSISACVPGVCHAFEFRLSPSCDPLAHLADLKPTLCDLIRRHVVLPSTTASFGEAVVPSTAVTAMNACITMLLGHHCDSDTQFDFEALLLSWLSFHDGSPILSNAARRAVLDKLVEPTSASPNVLLHLLSAECDVLDAIFPATYCESSQTFATRAAAVFRGNDGGDTVVKFPSISLLLRSCMRLLSTVANDRTDDSLIIIHKAQLILKRVVPRLVLALLSGRFLAGATGLLTTHVKDQNGTAPPLPPVTDPMSIAAAIAPMYPVLISLIVSNNPVLTEVFEPEVVTSSPLLPGQVLMFNDSSLCAASARQACVLGLLEASTGLAVVLQALYCQPENLMRYSLLCPTSPVLLPDLFTISEVASILHSTTVTSGYPCSTASLTNVILSLMPVVHGSKVKEDSLTCLKLAIGLARLAAGGRSPLQDASHFGGGVQVKFLQFLWYFRRDIQARMMSDMGWEVDVADSSVVPTLACLVVVRGVVAVIGSGQRPAQMNDDSPAVPEGGKHHPLQVFLAEKLQHSVGPLSFFAKVCPSLDPAKVSLSQSPLLPPECFDHPTLRWMLTCIASASLSVTEQESIDVTECEYETVPVLTGWCAVLLRTALARGVSIVAAISFSSTVNLLASHCAGSSISTQLSAAMAKGLTVSSKTLHGCDKVSAGNYVSTICVEVLQTYAIPSVNVIRELVEGVFWHESQEMKGQLAAIMLRVCCELPLDGSPKLFVAEQDACMVHSARQACVVLRSVLDSSVTDGTITDLAAFRIVITTIMVLSDDSGESVAWTRLISRSSTTLSLLKRIGAAWSKLSIAAFNTFAAIVTKQCDAVASADAADTVMDALQAAGFVAFVDAIPAVCRRGVAVVTGTKSGLSRALSKVVQLSSLLDQTAGFCKVRNGLVILCAAVVTATGTDSLSLSRSELPVT